MANESGWAAAIDRRMDPLTTFLMSLAALLSAWSGYQSTQWANAQTLDYSDASRAKQEASRLDLRANQQYQIDWSVYQGYMHARLDENARVAAFYEQRFPPRLERAFQDWLALRPEQNPQAPAHPFLMPSYALPDAAAAQAQKAQGYAYDAKARRASHISGRYTRTTVSFALVLFFCGFAPKAVWRASRLLMLGIAAGFLLFGGVFIATLPVSLT